MQPGKKALLLAVGMIAIAFVLFQTACKNAEEERKKAEAAAQAEQARKDAAQAQAAATWNQKEIEKAKAVQAQREIEVAKAKQAEENRINSDEWRALIWKVGKWVLGILALGVALFFAPIIWEASAAPVIAKRQELHDRRKHAQLYAAQEHALEEEAEIERMKAKQAKARAEERARQAEIEKAKAAQAEAPRQAAEENRKKAEADAKKAEAERQRAEEERKKAEAVARQKEQERLLKQAEAEKAKAAADKVKHDAATAAAKEKETGSLAKQAEAKKAEEERKRAEAERLKAEEERKKNQAEAKKETARLAAAEIERQNKLKEYPLSAHIDAFIQQAETLERWIADGEEENRVFDLYLHLQAALQSASKIPLEKRERIPEHHKQLNQVETLMDLYSEKIQRVQEDEALDDEEREEKKAYWRDLRNRQIAEIQGA